MTDLNTLTIADANGETRDVTVERKAVHGVTAVHGLTAMSGPLSTGIFAVNQEH